MKYQIVMTAHAFFGLGDPPIIAHETFLENHGQPTVEDEEGEVTLLVDPTYSDLYEFRNDPYGPTRHFFVNMDPTAGPVGLYVTTAQFQIENSTEATKDLFPVLLQVGTDHLTVEQIEAEASAINAVSAENSRDTFQVYLIPGLAEKKFQALGHWPLPPEPVEEEL